MLKVRGWTQADLANEMGKGRGVVHDVVVGRRGIGVELGVEMAKALGLPPEEFFRRLGIFPTKPDSDPLTEEGIHVLKQLEGLEKEDGVRYLKMRLQVQQERGKYDVRKRKERPSATR